MFQRVLNWVSREFQTSFLQIDINLNPFFLNKSCHLSSLFLTLLVLLHKFLFNLDTQSFELVRCIIFENTVEYVITFHENPFDNCDEFFNEYVRVIVHCRCLLQQYVSNLNWILCLQDHLIIELYHIKRDCQKVPKCAFPLFIMAST